MKVNITDWKMKMQGMNSLKYLMQEVLMKCMGIWQQKDSSLYLMIMYMFKCAGQEAVYGILPGYRL